MSCSLLLLVAFALWSLLFVITCVEVYRIAEALRHSWGVCTMEVFSSVCEGSA